MSVTKIFLPQRADSYDLAPLVENLNIGVWNCRATSLQTGRPNVFSKPSCLRMKTALRTHQWRGMRRFFRELGRKSIDRDVAAREEARLAASGHSYVLSTWVLSQCPLATRVRTNSRNADTTQHLELPHTESHENLIAAVGSLSPVAIPPSKSAVFRDWFSRGKQ